MFAQFFLQPRKKLGQTFFGFRRLKKGHFHYQATAMFEVLNASLKVETTVELAAGLRRYSGIGSKCLGFKGVPLLHIACAFLSHAANGRSPAGIAWLSKQSDEPFTLAKGFNIQNITGYKFGEIQVTVHHLTLNECDLQYQRWNRMHCQ